MTDMNLEVFGSVTSCTGSLILLCPCSCRPSRGRRLLCTCSSLCSAVHTVQHNTEIMSTKNSCDTCILAVVLRPLFPRYHGNWERCACFWRCKVNLRHLHLSAIKIPYLKCSMELNYQNLLIHEETYECHPQRVLQLLQY